MNVFSLSFSASVYIVYVVYLGLHLHVYHEGVVWGSGALAVFVPWDQVKDCKWLPGGRRLSLQCRTICKEFRVSPSQVETITAALRQFVPVHDGTKTVGPDRKTDAEADGEKGPADVRRYSFQFSLRTLMLLVVVASCGFSWLGIVIQQRVRQDEIIEQLEHLKPAVSRGDRDIDLDFSKSAVKPTDADLALLAEMPRLERLDLSNSPISNDGLAHLSGHTWLRSLDLTGTAIGDDGLKHLAGLTRLRRLTLDSTQITDAGLVHLKRLRRLFVVKVRTTQVTDQGVRELEELLPDTRIVP